MPSFTAVQIARACAGTFCNVYTLSLLVLTYIACGKALFSGL